MTGTSGNSATDPLLPSPPDSRAGSLLEDGPNRVVLDLPVTDIKSDSRLRGNALLYSVSVFLSIGVWLFG